MVVAVNTTAQQILIARDAVVGGEKIVLCLDRHCLARQETSVMNLDDYQVLSRTTAIYPQEDGAVYAVLGLVNESGELAGVWKKWLRGDRSWVDTTDKMAAELGDVLWYAAAVATELGLSLDDVAQRNIEKLSDRSARGVLRGDGDHR